VKQEVTSPECKMLYKEDDIHFCTPAGERNDCCIYRILFSCSIYIYFSTKGIHYPHYLEGHNELHCLLWSNE